MRMKGLPYCILNTESLWTKIQCECDNWLMRKMCHCTRFGERISLSSIGIECGGDYCRSVDRTHAYQFGRFENVPCAYHLSARRRVVGILFNKPSTISGILEFEWSVLHHNGRRLQLKIPDSFLRGLLCVWSIDILAPVCRRRRCAACAYALIAQCIASRPRSFILWLIIFIVFRFWGGTCHMCT